MTHKKGRKAKRYMGTFEFIRDLVHYDPDTGAMETLAPYKSSGTVMKDGYLHLPLPVDGLRFERGRRKTSYFRADHIAWMLVTGQWPDGWMEHINGIRMDNALDNLVHYTGEDGEYVRWWYGTQSPGEERKLVMVEEETVRVMAGEAVALKPVVVEEHRTARMRPVDEDDPHDEDYDYPKGEFGVDWT